MGVSHCARKSYYRAMSQTLHVRPIELRDANEFVGRLHRHHQPVQGHRFSISAWLGDKCVGVAIIGRPVARLAGSPLEVLEVTRLCTDGTPHACSILYAAAARAGVAMGYKRIQTYILETEPGTSLKAAGWTCEGEAGGGQWNHTGDSGLLWGGPNRRTDQPTCKKMRYAKALNTVKALPARTAGTEA